MDLTYVSNNELCPPLRHKDKLPKLIGPDRSTINHSKNVLATFDGTTVPRPLYWKNIDIIGTQSHAFDLSSTKDGYKDMNKAIKHMGRDLWLTMSMQEWNRVAPYKESLNYGWAPEARLLRE